METTKTDNSQGWKSVLKIIFPYLIVVSIFQAIGMLLVGVDFMSLRVLNQSPGQHFVITLMSMFGTVGIVWLFITRVDHKSFKSIGFGGEMIQKDLLAGLLLGFILISAGFLIILFTNQMELVAIRFNATDLLYSLGIFVFVAITEEVLFRGYILNNLMVSFNKYAALVISAVIFSLLHLANPNINVVGTLNIFMCGLLLGLPYIYTKKLWFPIALHFSWNFFQGPIFGFNVSGMENYNLIETKYTMANIWNGGIFGFEGSLLSVILIAMALVAVFMLFRNRIAEEPDDLTEIETETEELALSVVPVVQEDTEI